MIVWDRGTWVPMGDTEEGYRTGQLKFRLVGEKLRGGVDPGPAQERQGRGRQELALHQGARHLRPTRGRGRHTGRGAPQRALGPRRRRSRRAGHDHRQGGAAADQAGRQGAPGSTPRRPQGGAAGQAATAAGDAGGRATRRGALDPRDQARRLPHARPDRERPRPPVNAQRARLDRAVRGARRIARGMACATAVLDGEVCVQRNDGATSFAALQDALAAGAQGEADLFRIRSPLPRRLRSRPHPADRAQRALEALVDPIVGETSPVQFSDHFEGDGGASSPRRRGARSRVSSRRRRTRPTRRDARRPGSRRSVSTRGPSPSSATPNPPPPGGSARSCWPSGRGTSCATWARSGPDSRAPRPNRCARRFRRCASTKRRSRRRRRSPTPRGCGPTWRPRCSTALGRKRRLARRRVPGPGAGRGRAAGPAREPLRPRRRPRRCVGHQPRAPDVRRRRSAQAGSGALLRRGRRAHDARANEAPADTGALSHRRTPPSASTSATPAPVCRPRSTHPLREEGSKKRADYLYIDGAKGLFSLAQFGVVEFHPLGLPNRQARAPRPADLRHRPRRGARLAGGRGRRIRDRRSPRSCRSCHVRPDHRRQGLHVVVPVERHHSWSEIKDFSHGFVAMLERRAPGRFTASMSRAARRGRMFVDFLRNQRSATAVASYSLRARPGAPAATLCAGTNFVTSGTRANSTIRVCPSGWPRRIHGTASKARPGWLTKTVERNWGLTSDCKVGYRYGMK